MGFLEASNVWEKGVKSSVKEGEIGCEAADIPLNNFTGHVGQEKRSLDQ